MLFLCSLGVRVRVRPNPNTNPNPNMGAEASPEILRVVGVITFAETFRKIPFVLPRNAFVAETDIQPNLVGRRHFTET